MLSKPVQNVLRLVGGKCDGVDEGKLASTKTVGIVAFKRFRLSLII